MRTYGPSPARMWIGLHAMCQIADCPVAARLVAVLYSNEDSPEGGVFEGRVRTAPGGNRVPFAPSELPP